MPLKGDLCWCILMACHWTSKVSFLHCPDEEWGPYKSSSISKTQPYVLLALNNRRARDEYPHLSFFLHRVEKNVRRWHDILIHERICQALGRGCQSHRSSRTHVSYNKSKVEIIVFIYFVVVAIVVVAVVVFVVPFLNLNPWSGADWGQDVILSAQDPCTHACTLVHRAGNQVWKWPPPSAHSITPPWFQVEV